MKSTIKVSNSTKESIKLLKKHRRETYEDVIVRLIKKERYEEDTLVADGFIVKGEKISGESIILKPGTKGLSAKFMQKVVGKKALYNIKKGEPITFGLVNL